MVPLHTGRQVFLHYKTMAYASPKLITFSCRPKSLEWQTPDGFYFYRSIIQEALKHGKTWLTLQEGDLNFRVYLAPYQDTTTGKTYIIGAGYFPDTSAELVEN